MIFSESTHHMNERFIKRIDTLLAKAVHERITPGGILGVSFLDNRVRTQQFTYSFGFTEYGESRYPVTKKTYYDLASLTKPLVTTLSLMKMMEHEQLVEWSTLADILPFTRVPEDKKCITVRQLMSHCSGLPAHKPYYIDALSLKKNRRKDFYLESILSENLVYRPGEKHIYSDLGYIILGSAIEQLSGKPLQTVFRELTKSLGIVKNSFFFNPSIKDRKSHLFAATEVCPWTHERLSGVVHDDNCRVMGGVAGHAGLFGRLGGVLELCSFIAGLWKGMNNRNQLFESEKFRNLLKKQNGTTWVCGFDTPSQENSSSGKYFSSQSIGHLGFTGTSLWIDLERGISIVFLCNRVCPTRKNEKLKKFRPELHNLIMEHLLQ